MTCRHPSGPENTPPGGNLTELTDLLTTLDEFLRSSPRVSADLAAFMASGGHPHPGYAASLLINEVSFTALRLRQFTGHASASPADAPPGAPDAPFDGR